MRKSARIIAGVVLFIACADRFVWAQSPTAEPPFVQLKQGGVYPGAAPAAPAMSMKDVPLHPAEAFGQVPRMTFTSPTGSAAHMMPTIQAAAARRAAGLAGTGGPLVYHTGGSIMQPAVQIFAIFWWPSTLQNGNATGFPGNSSIASVVGAGWLPGHGLMSVATQYYQTISGTTTYVQDMGGMGAIVVDAAAYPASGCTDTATPGNCITDAQIQAKIQSVMTAQGWTGGLNKIYFLFTSQGEGSCFDNTNSSCAYTTYCGYHGHFSFGGQNVIYSNIPFGNPSTCQASGQTTPNDANGDLAANVVTHELMESVTDPLLDAWYDSSGNEIGDICAWIFGTNTWGSGTGAGNQMLNGRIMEVQEEYDNHASACVQAGPQ